MHKNKKKGGKESMTTENDENRVLKISFIIIILAIIFTFTISSVSAQTERVSETSNGTGGNDSSSYPSITPDGHYITFQSDAANLVPNDTNNVGDIFVKDNWNGSVIRISTTSTGEQATGGSSWNPKITPDGRYVTFTSLANNLVSGDTNEKYDVFVKDILTGVIIRASTSADNIQADDNSFSPVITPDGRYVAFYSYATNLVSGDTNSVSDIFVKDILTGAITRVSTTSTGSQATGHSLSPSITSDGQHVAFFSYATDLVNGDTNGYSDIFVKDISTGTITRVSTTSTGEQATGGYSFGAFITSDGHYVAFASGANNLVNDDTNNVYDIFVKNILTGAITRVSTTSTGEQATGGDSLYPVVTSDGRYVSFESKANNLVNGDTNNKSDIFVKDILTGLITRVSTTSNGTQATGGGSYSPSISDNGRYVTFDSEATNLVNGDINENYDVFMYLFPIVINSVDPMNGSVNVSTNKVITITFSEPIQAGNAYNNIKVITPARQAKTITKSINGNTLTITATYNYTPGTYTIYIPANAVKNAAGNSLTNKFNSTFTVAILPMVNKVDPANGSTVNNPNKVIKITFSEPIEAGSAYNNIKVITPAGQAKTITKTISGNVLTITATYNYTPGTYTIYIPANAVKNTAGNGLATNYTSTFTVNTTTPTVTSVDPANESTVNDVNKVITIIFNENIQAGSAYNNIKVITPTGQAKTISKSINGNVLTITPTYNYTPGTYTIYIPANAVRNTTGNGLAATYTSTFTINIAN